MKKKEAFDVLNNQLEKTSRMQIRDMGLEVLPRLIDTLDNLEITCTVCKTLNNQGLSYVENIKPLFDDDKKGQKEFEAWASKTQKHLEEKHKMKPKGKISSLYILAGIIIGITVGFITIYFTVKENYLGGAVTGWVIGSIVGWTVGKMKERHLIKHSKLY